MKKIISGFLRWRAAKAGATSIEYALIAAGISLAIIATIYALGDQLDIVYSQITAAMSF